MQITANSSLDSHTVPHSFFDAGILPINLATDLFTYLQISDKFSTHASVQWLIKPRE